MVAIGFTAAELAPFYSAHELARSGYTKEELKPVGAWKHDGEWQSYNQYWNCCFSLDKASIYCEPLKNMERLNSNRNVAAGMSSPTAGDSSFRVSQSRDKSFRLSREISGSASH